MASHFNTLLAVFTCSAVSGCQAYLCGGFRRSTYLSIDATNGCCCTQWAVEQIWASKRSHSSFIWAVISCCTIITRRSSIMCCGLKLAGSTRRCGIETARDTLMASWAVLLLSVAQAGGYIVAKLAVRACFTNVAR